MGHKPSSIKSVNETDGGTVQMTSWSDGTDGGLGRHWNQKPDWPGPLLLETHFEGRALVVRPVGELTPKTSEQLRDGLVKFAAEEPEALVVDLSSIWTTVASLLTVFVTVHDRINNWPGVPLILASGHQPLTTMLDFSGITRSVPTYSSVAEALKRFDAASHRLRRQVRLPCDPASAQLVRRFVKRACQEWGIPGMAADAIVVASELTDNLVRHARSDGWLRIDLRCNRLTIAVADAEPRQPQLRIPGLRAVGGRGLVLVDKLSRTWGTDSRPDGKVVWAVLTVAPLLRHGR